MFLGIIHIERLEKPLFRRYINELCNGMYLQLDSLVEGLKRYRKEGKHTPVIVQVQAFLLNLSLIV